MAAHTEEESWGQRSSICKDLEAEKISYYEIFCVTGVIIPCRARRACRTNSAPGRPEWPSETITVILGVDQKYNIQTLHLGLESGEPFPSFPSFFLLRDLPRHLSRVCFHPAAPPDGQAQDAVYPFVLRLLHLGKITVDPCIPQNEAPTRQVQLSLANTYESKRLTFDAWLC